MNITELIELLQEYPDDYNVFVCNEDGIYTNKIHLDNSEDGEIDIIGEE